MTNHLQMFLNGREDLSMQTKKRARPVKFGKDVKKEEPKKVVEEAVETSSTVTEEEKPKEPEIEKAEVKEEKVAVTEEKTNDDSEPMEVNLSEGPVEEPTKESVPDTESISETTPSSLEEKEADEPEKPSPFGSFTYDREARTGKKSNFRNFFIIAFFAFLIGLASMAGISYFLSGDIKDLTKITFQKETPTPLPTKEPVSTPTPEEVDLSAYTITVLNGSGLTGEAAKAKTQLIEAGFKVGTVGNASSSDYTKTTIAAKKDVDPQYLNELIATLKKTYKVNSVVETSSASATSEVTVTLGSGKAE